MFFLNVIVTEVNPSFVFLSRNLRLNKWLHESKCQVSCPTFLQMYPTEVISKYPGPVPDCGMEYQCWLMRLSGLIYKPNILLHTITARAPINGGLGTCGELMGNLKKLPLCVSGFPTHSFTHDT